MKTIVCIIGFTIFGALELFMLIDLIRTCREIKHNEKKG